jgi:hypothetical protein
MRLSRQTLRPSFSFCLLSPCPGPVKCAETEKGERKRERGNSLLRWKLGRPAARNLAKTRFCLEVPFCLTVVARFLPHETQVLMSSPGRSELVLEMLFPPTADVRSSWYLDLWVLKKLWGPAANTHWTPSGANEAPSPIVTAYVHSWCWGVIRAPPEQTTTSHRNAFSPSWPSIHSKVRTRNN